MRYTLDNNWLHIEINSLFVNTIQEFFDNYIPSKKVQHLLIQNKQILLDGNPVNRESDIAGLNLDINIYPEEHIHLSSSLKPETIYEDEIILIVNKPKDLLVHSDNEAEETMNRIVDAYYAEQKYINALPIHRLDKQTSGLLIYSKSPVFQPILDKELSEKQIRRNYLAFVKGKMREGETMVIDKPIGNDRHNPNKRIIYKNGQKAITKLRCLACHKAKNYSVLLCSLDTGRTHQIRVHLSSCGYPILNDELYGETSDLCIRMGLFAQNVEMYHPLKEENMTIEAELPNDLNKLYLEALR